MFLWFTIKGKGKNEMNCHWDVIAGCEWFSKSFTVEGKIILQGKSKVIFRWPLHHKKCLRHIFPSKSPQDIRTSEYILQWNSTNPNLRIIGSGKEKKVPPVRFTFTMFCTLEMPKWKEISTAFQGKFGWLVHQFRVWEKLHNSFYLQ